MSLKKQKIMLLMLLIIPVIIIFFSRQIFADDYLSASIYKIIYLFPIFFALYIEKKTIKRSLIENFSIESFKKNFFQMLFIGIALASIYLLSFLFYRNFFDTEIIANKLQNLLSLNARNLIYIGIYIIFINSLLEEFFWRGFVFQKLNKLISPWIAYVLSGIGFSLHHLMFYYNWFSLLFIILATLGLIVFAFIMNFIFQKYNDLFSCWLAHGIADMAQIISAFLIFY